MNKCFELILSILLMAITGCSSGSGGIPSPEPEKDVLSILVTEFSAHPEGGEVDVSFTTNCDWNVSSNSDWCVVPVSYGQKGTRSLTLKISANEDKKDRTAIVTVRAGMASGTITVVQKASDTKLEVTRKEFDVTHKGDELKISFITDSSWTVSSNQDWCELSDTEGDEGEKEITVIVKTNETDEERIAQVTIKAGSTSSTITITQGKKFYISTDSEAYKVSYIGGKIKVEVKHNVAYEILIDASWITEADSESDDGKEIIVLEAENNQGTEERKATITFYNQELDLKTSVVITQGGIPEDNSIQPNGSLGNMTWGDPRLEVSQKEFNVTHKGDELKIRFMTDASWTVSSNQDWCELSDTEGGEGEKEIKVTVKPNETNKDRIAKVIIQAGSTSSTITITQGKKLYISTDSETYKVFYTGGIIEVEVKHNVAYEILIDASWIKKTDSESGDRKDIIMFEAENNKGKERRKATITFYNQELDLKTSIVVTQGGIPEDNSIQPDGSLGNMTWG